MKKKTISIMIVALMSAMTATSMTGCGTQAAATNVQISEENLDETVVIDEEEIDGENADTESENLIIDDSEYIVLYGNQQGKDKEIVDLDSFTKLNDIELRFNADTDFYYTDGTVAGFIKAGAYVKFDGCKDQWVSFTPVLEGTDATTFLMNLEELEKNAVNENLVEDVSNEPALVEDVTDGNVVIYGGEKNPQKYLELDEGIPEVVSIELTNVEADIPLYSRDGRLCGHLNKGGSIEITEHCTVATAWYRFPNPIEGTEHEYLYVLRYELVMSSDEKESIEETLREEDYSERTEFLNAPEADMNCYEFSIAREKYFDLGPSLINCEFLQRDEFDNLKYLTFYVECTRNGDYFDCKVYYK